MRVRVAAVSIWTMAMAVDWAVASAVVVDDGGGPGVQFTDLQAAVNGAPNGGLILVKGGSYASFVVSGKSLVITAEANQTVTVSGSVTISNLSAAQSFAMSGIDVVSPSSSGFNALQVTDCIGPVLIERGEFTGAGIPLFLEGAGGRFTNSSHVTCVDCEFRIVSSDGPSPGLVVSESTASLYFCSAIGGTGVLTSQGGTGCRLLGGFLFAAGSTLRGGTGSIGNLSQPFGICSDGGKGGTGLVLSSAFSGAIPTARLLDTSLVGGAGGAPGGPACNPGPPGDPSLVEAGTIGTFAPKARRYDIPSPVREGTNGTITLSGDPGELVWLFFSAVQSPAFSSLWKGTLLPGVPQLVIFVGALPASGTVTFNVVVPVDPSTVCVSLIEQALYHQPSTGFVASNPRLGVVLDASL